MACIGISLRKQLQLLLLALLIGGSSGLAWGKPYALVLASYHPGFAWSDAQLQGLRETLARHRPDLPLRIEYMDAKHVAPSEAGYHALTALLKEKYAQAPPAILIAQDDDALDFILRQRQADGLFGMRPVVFSGVSGARAGALAGQSAITGIFDDADIAANVALLQRIRPGLKTIHFIHDQSRTGQAQAENVRLWQARFPQLTFSFLTGMSVGAVKKRLGQLGTTDAVIALAFNRDAEDRVLDHAEAAAEWGKAASAPVLVKEEEMMAPGILGGILLSGHREGAAAAEHVLRILDGADPKSLPMTSGIALPVFADAALQRFGIDRSQLPPGAQILGEPRSLRQTHPVEFWVTITLLSAAGFIILQLVIFGARQRRAKRAALASERNYREIFNASNEAVIIHDVDGRVVDVNERFFSLFGYPTDTPPTALQAFAGSDEFTAEEARSRIQKSLSEGPQLFEWQTRRADGSLFWVDVALKSAVISGEQRVLAAVRDISGRKASEAALRHSEARYDLLLRHTPVGIMHLSTDWTLSYCNDRFTDIIGAPRSAIVGSDMRQLRDRSIEPALQQALAGEAAAYQGEYTSTASGRHFWVDLRAAPVLDEQRQVIGAIVIIDDITDRVAAEKALKAFNETLEQKIAERTEALSLANHNLRSAMTQLAEADKMAALGALVAGVSHELNTPIGNARMLATTLSDIARDLAANYAKQTLRKSTLEQFLNDCQTAASNLDNNLERAATLIGNFKQLAVDQTSMRRRRFMLGTVLTDTLALVRQSIDKAGCSVCLEADETIEMDSFPGGIEQVIMNLVNNSLIHGLAGRENKRIALSAHRLPDDDRISITYTDNGSGMSEETAHHAFEPFFTTAFGQGGSGLGLFIVHNVVNGLLGGQVALRSTPGEGTTFVIDLPLQAPAPPAG